MGGFLGFGGNDSPPPAPTFAAPPPPPEILHTIDEITGTETLPVTDPTTGDKTLVTRALPLSEQEQKWLDQAKSLMETSSGEFERLYDYGPQNIVDFTPYSNFIDTLSEERTEDLKRLLPNRDFTNFINSFKNARQAALNEQFEQQRGRLKADLDRSGWENSTASSELKAAMAAQEARARENLDVEATEYGQNLYDRDLARRSNEFQFAESGRASRMNDMQNKYLLNKEYKNSLEDQRQKAIEHQKMLYGIGESIVGAETRKKLSTMAPKLALAENQLTAQNQHNYYMADMQRQNLNYQNKLAEYNNQPPSFGQQLMTLGGQIGGAMFNSAPGTVAGQWGQKLFAPGAPSYPNESSVPASQVGNIRRK